MPHGVSLASGSLVERLNVVVRQRAEEPGLCCFLLHLQVNLVAIDADLGIHFDVHLLWCSPPKGAVIEDGRSHSVLGSAFLVKGPAAQNGGPSLGGDPIKVPRRPAKEPVLLLQGEDDNYGSEDQIKRLEKTIVAPVRSSFILNSGHAPHYDNADVVIKLTEEFCTELS